MIGMVSAVLAPTCLADDQSYASSSEEVVQLRDELYELRSRLDDLERIPSVDYEKASYADHKLVDDSGGGSCHSCSTCCNCVCRSRLTFGFDFVFLQPRFIESWNVQVTNPATTATTLQPLDFDYSLSPRFYLGYKSPAGFGIRAQYWQYDDSTSDTFVAGPTAAFTVQQLTSVIPAAIAAVPGDTLNVINSFETQTLDIEATYDINSRFVQMTSSLGVRYAELNQQRQASVTGVFPQSLNFERDYKGFGLVAGFDGRRPIGNWGLAAVFRGRGSVVHGNKTLNRSLVPATSPPLPPLPPLLLALPAAPPSVSLNDANETSLIGEIALGLELRRELRYFGLFTRVMYENRFWTAASTPALGLAGFEGISVGVGASR